MGRVISDSKLVSNPKFFNLVELLKVGKLDAFWNLHHLWYWCSDHYPDGVMKNVSDVSLAFAAQWPGEPKAFVDALVKSRFLDREPGALVVHDWQEWRPEYVRSRDRRIAVRPENDRKVTGKRPENDRKVTNSEHSNSSVVLSFPVSGETKTWELREDMLLKLRDLYPGVDVLGVCKKALFWVDNNPKKRKTGKRMLQWLANVWLEKEQNRSHSGDFPKHPDKNAEFQEELERRRKLNEHADRIISGNPIQSH
jgi:hypothetical protein